MLGDPKRLRTPGGHGYLVSWKHRLRSHNDADAKALVEQILELPANVEALRNALSRPEASEEELADWLIGALVSGSFQVLKTRVEAPVMDAPPETDLFDLLPPDEPKRELDSLTFEVVDSDGEGVATRFQVYAPSGESAGALPAGQRRMVGDLERHAHVEVDLEAIVLPLRQDEGADPVDDEDPDVPPPLGPGGTEPVPSDPLGPVAPPVDPDEHRFPLFRLEPPPFEVAGNLALPDGEHRHFIPVVLSAIAAARTNGATQIWLVSFGPADLAAARAASVEAVLRDDAEAWVELATSAGSLDDVRGYLEHLRTNRGWSDAYADSGHAEVEAFQAEYNRRFDAAILEDGVCGVQTLGAVFAVIRDELDRWLPMFELTLTDLSRVPVQCIAPAAVEGTARNLRGEGLDVWVFDEAQLPAPADLDLLYGHEDADVHPVEVPWSFENDELVVRLRAESDVDLAGFVAVRVASSDGDWVREHELEAGTLEQHLVFEGVPVAGRYTVSLVRTDGTREVLAADQPFTAFLDDRRRS